jgi:hypothetical protein
VKPSKKIWTFATPSVLAFEVRDFATKRIVAAGCQDGLLHLCIYEKRPETSDLGDYLRLNEVAF